jgi:hypothetical protein
VTQHATLSEERWARFSHDQQILMIANEMNRTSQRLGNADRTARRNGYERILRLTDLTVAQSERRLRRELLRWRDLVAELYIANTAEPELHRCAFRALLQLHPTAARQIPLLLP